MTAYREVVGSDGRLYLQLIRIEEVNHDEKDQDETVYEIDYDRDDLEQFIIYELQK